MTTQTFMFDQILKQYHTYQHHSSKLNKPNTLQRIPVRVKGNSQMILNNNEEVNNAGKS